MKHPFARLLALALAGLFFNACQTTEPDKKFSSAQPSKAKPLPSWTKKPDEIQGEQQVFITTKLIEVSRPAGSAEIPDGRYERKLDDPQFQVLIRELTQKKGTDLMSAPSVVTRNGQKAKVKTVREFSYPVAPGDDANKEVEDVGVTSLFEARLVGENNISLKTFTRVCELDGFAPVTPEFDIPVFKRRDVEASATLESGETILVGGIVDEITQDVEDTGPLGVISKRSTENYSRELIVAVTVTLLDSEGMKIAAR